MTWLFVLYTFSYCFSNCTKNALCSKNKLFKFSKNIFSLRTDRRFLPPFFWLRMTTCNFVYLRSDPPRFSKTISTTKPANIAIKVKNTIFAHHPTPWSSWSWICIWTFFFSLSVIFSIETPIAGSSKKYRKNQQLFMELLQREKKAVKLMGKKTDKKQVLGCDRCSNLISLVAWE